MAKNNKPTSDELNRFVPAGLKWLYEMEAVNSPALLNNLYGNIFSFPNVDDAEILIDKNNRKMLILIRFNWISRKIFKSRKREATISILDQLQELLPSFEFRIIEDRALFDLAVKRMTEQVLGGKNEDPTPSAPVEPVPAPVDDRDAIESAGLASVYADGTVKDTRSESQPEPAQADSKKQSGD